MKIAIDFDGTLWDHAGVQGPNVFLIEVAKRIRANAHRLILWTCRYDGHGLEEAVSACRAHGLAFDAINDNLPEVKEGYGNPRKIVADLYIDDRSAHPTSIDPLLISMVSKG